MSTQLRVEVQGVVTRGRMRSFQDCFVFSRAVLSLLYCHGARLNVSEIALRIQYNVNYKLILNDVVVIDECRVCAVR